MEILPEVWKHVVDAGVQPAGPPFIRSLEETGSRCTKVPGGKAAVTGHVGPYEKLPDAYEAFDKWSK